MKFINFVKNRFYRVFALDYRSMALFRIGMGVTILLDLIQRLTDLRAHYTDAGIFPRTALYQFWSNLYNFSLHSMFGVWQLELILFIIAGIFAIMLIVGWRTTLATVASWVLLVSVQNRNPAILQGGDVIFRTMLFFAMFIPWGKYFSVDALTHNYKIKKETFLNAGTIGCVIQVFMFYFYAGILKSGEFWTTDGTAIYYTLNIDQLVTHFGHYLLQFPTLLMVLTFSVLYLEIYGSILLLSPFATGPIRTLIILLYAFMQIGINMSLPIGLFGLISIVITLPLLPSWFWDNIVNKIKTYIQNKRKVRGTLYYDFDCSFCAKVSRIIVKILFLERKILIKSSEEDLNVRTAMERENSWVFVDSNGNQFYRIEAFRNMLSLSPVFFFFAPILKIKLVENFGNKVYRKISEGRMQICLPEEIQTKESLKKKVLVNMVAGSMCVYVFVFNLQWLDAKYKINNENFDRIAQFTQMNQKFDMFAPYPTTDDGWYVIAGKLEDGNEVDIFRGGAPVSFEKPEDVASLYKNQRWQKYMMNLWSSDFEQYRLYYGQYLCREWNRKHEGSELLQTFDIIFMLERTKPNYETPDIVPTTIWKHTCF